jgi:hypothetical protein
MHNTKKTKPLNTITGTKNVFCVIPEKPSSYDIGFDIGIDIFVTKKYIPTKISIMYKILRKDMFI